MPWPAGSPCLKTQNHLQTLLCEGNSEDNKEKGIIGFAWDLRSLPLKAFALASKDEFCVCQAEDKDSGSPLSNSSPSFLVLISLPGRAAPVSSLWTRPASPDSQYSGSPCGSQEHCHRDSGFHPCCREAPGSSVFPGHTTYRYWQRYRRPFFPKAPITPTCLSSQLSKSAA